MECYLKIHSRSPNYVIGVCDKEILGKKLKNEQNCFNVSEVFFKDQLVSIEKALEILKNCHNFNAVGENIVNALISHKLIHPEGILKIEGIPIAIRLII